MDLNKYSIYSVVSSKVNEETLNKVLELVNDFKNFENCETAKEYLKNKYSIKDAVQNYPLGANSYLSISDSTNVYIVNVKYENNNVTFSYQKQ
mgnify:CR=1 FL=1